MDKITAVISMGASEATGGTVGGGGGGTEEDGWCPSLTFKTRVTCCAMCFALGMIFAVLCWVTVFIADYVFFGVLFTMSSLCFIGGTFFLAGPVKQFHNMFNEGRWIASTVYFVTMIMTILCAVLLHSGLLVLICSLVQFGAMWWYFLSYVPFARDAVKSIISSIMSN